MQRGQRRSYRCTEGSMTPPGGVQWGIPGNGAEVLVTISTHLTQPQGWLRPPLTSGELLMACLGGDDLTRAAP